MTTLMFVDDTAKTRIASAARVIDRSRALTQRLQITPRLAFIAGIAGIALVGFFVGQGLPGVK